MLCTVKSDEGFGFDVVAVFVSHWVPHELRLRQTENMNITHYCKTHVVFYCVMIVIVHDSHCNQQNNMLLCDYCIFQHMENHLYRTSYYQTVLILMFGYVRTYTIWIRL